MESSTQGTGPDTADRHAQGPDLHHLGGHDPRLLPGTFLIYPMIILLMLSFDSAADIILGPARLELFELGKRVGFTPGLLESLWNSCLIWFLVTAIGLPVGILIALWALARTRHPGIEGPGGLLLDRHHIIPILASTLGWTMLLSPGWGFLNKSSGAIAVRARPGPFNIYTVPGIVFTKLMAGGIAFNVVLLTPRFPQHEPGAGRGGSRRWSDESQEQ